MAERRRIFFSHASEDKGRMLQVYGKLLEHHPDLDPWVDTFEITGGQVLLDKIAEGMDAAERFFVFLSPVSIKKPWVQAELKRALTQEIGGERPDFVVPIKMGGLTEVPPFVEAKKYIDLDRLTEHEWVAEIYAAATGTKLPSSVATTPNVVLLGSVVDPHNPALIQYQFEVQHWAEKMAVRVETTTRVEDISCWLLGYAGMASVHEAVHDTWAATSWPDPVMAGNRFVVEVVFPTGVDAQAAITGIGPWDGSGFTSMSMRMHGA
ncbi:toll/interleukin-1 receptor domain-containing protein [Nocardioides aquiterrae]|uniref:TIR domain-containing protein n=1 Tax=Nocardioides aquiterrae TaxID=203799 RepID=A0ABP4F7K3_9ACTN